MYNQAAAFSCCLTKVQENMSNQLKIIQSVTSKGNSSSKLHQAADELDYLVTFNRSITQAMARTMQDLSDGVFINVENFTLARRDSYLDFIKTGIKQDTLISLRTAPLHMSALFPDHIISKAEEEIRHHEDKHTLGPSRKAARYHRYSQANKPRQKDTGQKSAPVTGKDCYSVTGNSKTRTHLPVYCHVANLVPFADGLPQKKGVNPDHQMSIKSVKGVSCVGQLSSVTCVTNVPTVAPDPPAGARMIQFWEKWAVSPEVVTVLKEGYTLPFQYRPDLTRSPKVITCYVNPDRNIYLLKALYQLLNKNAVELVTTQTSLDFYNRLFLVPKPNNRWRLILDTSVP